MSAHQALAHRLEARTLLLGEVEEAELLAREDLRVLADQVLYLGPGLGVERVVGRAHVGELRVAALRGDRARVQDRVLRRDHLERAVGVPQPVADREQSPPVVPREDVVVLVEVGHVGEGRRQPVLVGSAQAGADCVLELTEAPAEGELLLVGELLIVEDEHGVLVHPGMDRLDVGGGERPREVDTADFSGETGTDLASRDGHRRQPPRNRLSPAAHTGGWLVLQNLLNETPRQARGTIGTSRGGIDGDRRTHAHAGARRHSGVRGASRRTGLAAGNFDGAPRSWRHGRLQDRRVPPGHPRLQRPRSQPVQHVRDPRDDPDRPRRRSAGQALGSGVPPEDRRSLALPDRAHEFRSGPHGVHRALHGWPTPDPVRRGPPAGTRDRPLLPIHPRRAGDLAPAAPRLQARPDAHVCLARLLWRQGLHRDTRHPGPALAELHRQRLARRVAFLLGREPRLPPSGQRGFPAALRRPRLATRDRLPPAEGLTMKEPTVVRLAQTERVSFGPLSHSQLIIGDDEGSTPVRTGIQTAQPGYEAPLHSHPYVEILHILDGAAEAWIEGREDEPIVLEQGDTLAIPPDTPHSFRVRGDRVLRLLGTHASSRRIVAYKDGAQSDARGYRVVD